MNYNMSGKIIFCWDFMSMVFMSEILTPLNSREKLLTGLLYFITEEDLELWETFRWSITPVQFTLLFGKELKSLWTCFFFEKKYLSQQGWEKKFLFSYTAAIPLLMKVSHWDEKSYNRCNFMKHYIVATIASKQISL